MHKILSSANFKLLFFQKEKEKQQEKQKHKNLWYKTILEPGLCFNSVLNTALPTSF